MGGGLIFDLQGAIPGFQDEFNTNESEFTWGATFFNDSFVRPVLIDGASRDTGNTPTTIIRAGMLMSADNASKKWRPWIDQDATFGKLSGILLFDVDTQIDNADSDKLLGGILVGGNVKFKQLIEELLLTVGNASAAARTQLIAVPFNIDDSPFVP